MNEQQAQALAMIARQATGRNLVPVGRIDAATRDRIRNTVNLPDFSGNGGGNSAQVMREVKRLAKKVDSLSSRVDNIGRFDGGKVLRGDRNAGLVAGLHDGKPGHGGINASNTETFAAATEIAADSVYILEVDGTSLRRVQGTELCKFEAVAGNDIQAAANNITVDVLVNDDPIPSAKNIPLSYIIPNTDGENRFWPLDRFIEANEQPTFRVTFNEAVTPTNEETLYFRLLSGRCQ